MKKVSKHISVVTAPISIPKEEMFDCAIVDKNLISHICEFRKMLEKQDIEVYARKDNIIATENGYYTAMYTDDIRNMEGGIDNPIPFRGKDGRMKVDIKKENGEWVVRDLAELVAMAYCQNPFKYRKTWFKSGDPQNCDADNIIWVSQFEYFILKSWFNIKQTILKIFK